MTLKQKALATYRKEYIKAHAGTGIAAFDDCTDTEGIFEYWTKQVDALIAFRRKSLLSIIREEARMEARWDVYLGKMSKRQFKAWSAKQAKLTPEQRRKRDEALERKWEKEASKTAKAA